MEITEKVKSTGMFWAALFALIIGAGVGLIAIIAPLGFRMNLWEYRTGFTILRTMVPYTIYITGICIALAIALGILGNKWNAQNTYVLVGLAIAGAIVAGLTWIVPQTYLEPDGDPYPSIHDISTDTVNPPRFVAVMPLR